MKPKYIIDISRQHGGEIDTDYLYCTDSRCPLVACVKIITLQEREEIEKAEHHMFAFGEKRGNYCSCVKAIDTPYFYDARVIKSLLHGAADKYDDLISSSIVDTSNVNTSDVLTLMRELIRQEKENIVLFPDKKEQYQAVLAILMKIKNDYNEK